MKEHEGLSSRAERAISITCAFSVRYHRGRRETQS
jgi:hypothetical protein